MPATAPAVFAVIFPPLANIFPLKVRELPLNIDRPAAPGLPLLSRPLTVIFPLMKIFVEEIFTMPPLVPVPPFAEIFPSKSKVVANIFMKLAAPEFADPSPVIEPEEVTFIVVALRTNNEPFDKVGPIIPSIVMLVAFMFPALPPINKYPVRVTLIEGA